MADQDPYRETALDPYAWYVLSPEGEESGPMDIDEAASTALLGLAERCGTRGPGGEVAWRSPRDVPELRARMKALRREIAAGQSSPGPTGKVWAVLAVGVVVTVAVPACVLSVIQGMAVGHGRPLTVGATVRLAGLARRRDWM